MGDHIQGHNVQNVVLPTSTITPGPEPGPTSTASTLCQPDNKGGAATAPASTIYIEIAPASDADDTALITRLTDIINAVYLETEAGIWNPGFQRTTPEQVAGLTRAGELAVAYHHQEDTDAPVNDGTTNKENDKAAGRVAVGCVHIQKRSPTHAEFGMLSLDQSLRGGGHGRAMVLFAEDHARRVFSAGVGSDGHREDAGIPKMQLHLLVPMNFEHAFKARLRAWYQRMGYVEVGQGDVASDFPDLAPLLAGPAVFYVFEKALF